jgi:hypothetical protein
MWPTSFELWWRSASSSDDLDLEGVHADGASLEDPSSGAGDLTVGNFLRVEIDLEVPEVLGVTGVDLESSHSAVVERGSLDSDASAGDEAVCHGVSSVSALG